MKTIKYYTNSNLYKGWCKYSNDNYLTLISWLDSGNYVIINNKTIKNINQLPKL